MEREIYPLFSKPIFKTSIDVSSFDPESIKWARNYKNSISQTQDVLSAEEHKPLLKAISAELFEFFYGAMGAKNDIEIYITESWFNKTIKGESHHRHWHPNSLYSSIVYLGGDEGSGNTTFITSQYDTIEYEIANPNIYNSRSWQFAPKVGDMLIFPSNVENLVEEYQGDNPRITLSFNTFVRGPLNSNALTRLEL